MLSGPSEDEWGVRLNTPNSPSLRACNACSVKGVTHEETNLCTHTTCTHMQSCKCQFRCCHSRAGVDILKDDVCLCGVGTLRVQSKSQEEDIIFVTYENEVGKPLHTELNTDNPFLYE